MVFHIPHLYFAHAAGVSTGDRKACAVRREAHGFNSFTEANQTSFETGAVGLVQKHFMEAGYGKQFAVRRIIDGSDHWRQGVHGRVVGGVTLAGAWGRVILSALGDPFFDELDLSGVQGFFTTRHRGLACFWVRQNLFNYSALIYFAGHDCRPLIIAAREEAFEIGHHIPTFIFGRLMTALAVGLEEGADLVVVTNFAGRVVFVGAL